MATKLEILNSALIKLGQEKITSDSDSTTKRGITVVEQYTKKFNALLKEHSWNVAQRRIKMSVETLDVDASDVSAANNTFSHEKHGYVSGQKVQISTDDTLPAGLSANTDYYLVKSTVDLFKLATSVSNAIAGTAIDITTAGTGTHTLTPQDITPEFEYDFQFTLPSDYLKLEKVTSDDCGELNIDHEEENAKLLTNDNPVFMVYTSSSALITEFPADFAEVLAFEIAIDSCYDITQSKELKVSLQSDLAAYKALVRFQDGVVSKKKDFQVNQFIRSRY